MALPDGLLSSAEVVAQKGVARRTLRKWVKDGKLEPAYKLDGVTGAHFYRPADIDRLVARRKAKAARAAADVVADEVEGLGR